MASLFPVHIHIHLRKADSICCCFSTLLLQNLSTTFTLEENRHLIHSPHSHLPTSSSSPNNTLHWSHHGSGTAHFLFHRSLLNTFWKIFFQFPIENFLCYSIFQELFLILWMVPYFVSSFFFGCAAHRILALWPGIKPMPLAMEVWYVNHSTAKEVPLKYYFCIMNLTFSLSSFSLLFSKFELSFCNLRFLSSFNFFFICLHYC